MFGWLAYRRQIISLQTGRRRIIITNHRHILRDAQTQLAAQHIHNGNGHMIIRYKQRIRNLFMRKHRPRSVSSNFCTEIPDAAGKQLLAGNRQPFKEPGLAVALR